jgi:hypothetical protein
MSAFQTNGTVTELTIGRIRNLEGGALGTCLGGLVQNMPQLQRLFCHECSLRLEGVRAFQSGLRSNRSVKYLKLSDCQLGDDCIRLIAEALVGNTKMDKLKIRGNNWGITITPVGLDNITTLIESSQLKTIGFVF